MHQQDHGMCGGTFDEEDLVEYSNVSSSSVSAHGGFLTFLHVVIIPKSGSFSSPDARRPPTGVPSGVSLSRKVEYGVMILTCSRYTWAYAEENTDPQNELMLAIILSTFRNLRNPLCDCRLTLDTM